MRSSIPIDVNLYHSEVFRIDTFSEISVHEVNDIVFDAFEKICPEAQLAFLSDVQARIHKIDIAMHRLLNEKVYLVEKLENLKF